MTIIKRCDKAFSEESLRRMRGSHRAGWFSLEAHTSTMAVRRERHES
jgi:hypothetical protein